MRRLLVASQKGGVGKTTTSMNLAAAAAMSGTRVLLLDADPLCNISTALNLAEHPQRRLLRRAGIDLPGILIANLIPGLDLFSPYDEGPCKDEDFARLLSVLATPCTQERYGCIIIDAAPFLGGNAAALLPNCDDFLLVMRAEAMAYRTLPAFLELVQRSSRGGRALPMRGILLTLPEGEQPGCHWERELRGRFGTRVLAEVIPHDESIVADLRGGQIGSHAHPDSPAGRQYHQLAVRLDLGGEASPGIKEEQILQTLREASELADPSPAPLGAAGQSSGGAPRPSPLVPRETPTHRPRRLSRSGESLRPARSERALAPLAGPAGVPMPNMGTKEQTANALAQLWPLWILLGAVLGGGLRLMPLPPSLLPYLVGLGAALIVVVVCALVIQMRRESSTPAKKRGWLRRLEAKKTPPRTEARQDFLSARLAALASIPKRTRRDTDAN